MALPVSGRLDVMVGVDTYMTRRQLTPDLQAATGVLATESSHLGMARSIACPLALNCTRVPI